MTHMLLKFVAAIVIQQVVEWSAVLIFPSAWALGVKVLSMVVLVSCLYWFQWSSQPTLPNKLSAKLATKWIGFGVWCLALGTVCVLGASLALVVPGLVLLLFFSMLLLSYWDHECRFFFAFHDVLRLGKLGIGSLALRVALPIVVFGLVRQMLLPAHEAPWVNPLVYVVNLTAEMVLLVIVVVGASSVYARLRSKVPLPEWLSQGSSEQN